MVLCVEFGKGEKESGMCGLGKLLTDSFLAHLSPEAWVEKPSFGKPLEEHLMISGREIAFPIEACVTMLLECGMQEEVGTKQPCPPCSWPVLSRGRVLKSFSPLASPTLDPQVKAFGDTGNTVSADTNRHHILLGTLTFTERTGLWEADICPQGLYDTV